MKKLLALLMAVAVTFQLVTPVFADTEGTEETTAPTEAVVETEAPTEAPTEEPTEPEDTLVLAWSWVDSLQSLTPDTGVLALAADPAYPLSFEDVLTCLPTAVLAYTEAGEQTLPVAAWHCDEYPAQGAYEGAYTFVADLPQGYTPALTIPVLFAQPVTLEQEYVARIGETEYTSLEGALNAASSGATIELLTDCTLSGNGEANAYILSKSVTINLNGQTLTGGVQLYAANLTINGSAPDSKMNGSIRCTHASDRLTINGGTYTNNTGSFLTVNSIDTLTITAGEFIGGTYALDLSTHQVEYVRNITGGTFHGIYVINSNVGDCRPEGYRFEENNTPSNSASWQFPPPARP